MLAAPFLPEFNIDRVMPLLFWKEKKKLYVIKGKRKKEKKEKIEPVRETVILLPWESL